MYTSLFSEELKEKLKKLQKREKVRFEAIMRVEVTMSNGAFAPVGVVRSKTMESAAARARRQSFLL